MTTVSICLHLSFGWLFTLFFHQSIIPTSSGWSPTYLFPACIWGQSSAAHNWIPGWKTHIYWGCYSIWYTVSNLIKIKWAKKCSMKYQRHHRGFVSYLWKCMFSAVKVSAWQSLPPLSYSPGSSGSVSVTDTFMVCWNCTWLSILVGTAFVTKKTTWPELLFFLTETLLDILYMHCRHMCYTATTASCPYSNSKGSAAKLLNVWF